MRRSRSILAILLLVMACQAGALDVQFEYADARYQGLASRLQDVWDQHGDQLVRDLVPAGVPLQTVYGALLDTDSMRQRMRGLVADWGVGAALPGGRVIVLDADRIVGTGPGPETVFLHEMTHALLEQSVGEARLPHWFHEGVAMRTSGEWRFVDSLAVILSGRVPSLHQLDHAFPRPRGSAQTAYRTSLAAVTFLEREHGPDAVPQVLAATRALGSFAEGLQAVTGRSAEQFAGDFARSMRVRYGWVLMIFRWPTLFVIMAVLFAIGAIRKIIINKRALRMDEEGER